MKFTKGTAKKGGGAKKPPTKGGSMDKKMPMPMGGMMDKKMPMGGKGPYKGTR